MMLDHRAKAYYGSGGSSTIVYSGHTTILVADFILQKLLATPGFTGGHLEKHVQGIGWVLSTDDSEEIERRRVDDDTLYPKGGAE